MSNLKLKSFLEYTKDQTLEESLMTEKNNDFNLDDPFYALETGGSIGSGSSNTYMDSKPGRVVATFKDKVKAQEYAKNRRKQLSPGERGYYEMGYRVVKGNRKRLNNIKESFSPEALLLNEMAASWDKMKFQVSINDKNGLTISFIPDGKTLDSASKDILAERIHDRFVRSMPILAQALEYDSSASEAGITFKFDKYTYTESLTRALNSGFTKKR